MGGQRVSTVTVEGLAEARKSLAQFIKTLGTVPTQVLSEEAPKIQQVARLRTPVDSGKLKNSVKVKVSKDKRRPGLLASASALHNGYDYAYIQHENEEYNHPRGGQAKFLESAYNEGVERIKRRLSQEVKYDK